MLKLTHICIPTGRQRKLEFYKGDSHSQTKELLAFYMAALKKKIAIFAVFCSLIFSINWSGLFLQDLL